MIDFFMVHVQTELRSELKAETVAYEDEDTAKLDLHLLRLDLHKSLREGSPDGFYASLNGLAAEEARAALPSLEKYQDRRLVTRAGVVLNQTVFDVNIGRDYIQQGNIFIDAPHDPWIPPYFRYFAPYPSTAEQLTLRFDSWGVWTLQLTNDVHTEDGGRGQFNGSYRQPAWLGHVTVSRGAFEITAGAGEYDIRNSRWFELRLAASSGPLRIRLNATQNELRLKIGPHESEQRLDQGLARFLVINQDWEWNVTDETRLQLRASLVKLKSSSHISELPERLKDQLDGSLRVSQRLALPAWELGLSLAKRSSLLPKDLPQTYRDQERLALVIDLHADISWQATQSP